MVVASHPLASAAGAQLLAEGGNAVDAAVAALFALTIVEPMMVGIFGGGLMHIRRPDGTHVVLDGLGTAPAAARPDMYEVDPATPPHSMDVRRRENAIGGNAVTVPGNLAAWCTALRRHGRASLADTMAPAIRAAERGFTVSPYLHECTASIAEDLTADPAIARLLLPDGTPLRPGARLLQPEAAETLRCIARDGEDTLYHGAIGAAAIDGIARRGGCMTRQDLADYRLVERQPVRGLYRGHEIVGPPPPAASGVHIVQMLKILEGFDIAARGFGSADTLHLLAEVLKIAFADRAAATGDPAFVEVPVTRLMSDDYAAERRAALDTERARQWSAGVAAHVSGHTTHLTVADGEGTIVVATHTINNLFGARFLLPGLGLIPNNYMSNFDPRPGGALSIMPGKRITTSMSPMIVLRDGRPAWALGLPGGLRIFGSAMQTIINLIDHGMSLQEAVEAPRLWTQGQDVEVEAGFPPEIRDALARRGHRVNLVAHVGGGMNAIAFAPDGTLTGAACWRADGTPVGIGGGYARPGVRFWPDQAPTA
ncbi:MAG: gamma-glutamyltransferase [Acidisphaera sp.]|nr:gamma-glutamyltransferase [Acidisphaera sp.]